MVRGPGVDDRLRVAHVVHTISRNAGGPRRSVPALSWAQAMAGHEVTIFVTPDAYTYADGWPPDINVQVCDRAYGGTLSYSPDLVRRLLEFEPHIIHSHGLWSLVSHSAQQASVRLGAPHLCAPRGCLDSWSLQHHGTRKRLARILYQDRVLKRLACIHALTPAENSSIRGLGFRKPIAVVSNGISVPSVSRSEARRSVDDQHPEVRGKKLAIFISRIHPQKGLPNLIEGWAMVGEAAQHWHLAIAGPDVGGHEAEIRRQVAQAGLDESVSFLGPLSESDVMWHLAAADVFVLPSFSEAFSMAILEAMAAGTAVCISDRCNFPLVAEAGCGIIFSPGPQPIRDALRQVMRLSPGELETMGSRGRSLALMSFSWESIAQQMVQVYRWLLDTRLPAPWTVDVGL